jgi:hypothetical protein
MILTAQTLRTIESADRRVLGAFRLVDHATRLPLVVPARIEARSAAIVELQPDGTTIEIQPVAVSAGAVRIRQNRIGRFVVHTAPLFDDYTAGFASPNAPAILASPARRLRLQLAVSGAGTHHLPRTFAFDLPRSLDPRATDSVFSSQEVELFRGPAAPVQEGWAVLRASVVHADTGIGLPGVLIRVFRRPRQPGDGAIGAGLSEWRDERLRGEALVSITGLQRFVPGVGPNVIDTTHAIDLEVTRDTSFTGASGTVPDVDRLLAGTGDGVVRPPDQPPGSAFSIRRPTPPLAIAAGEQVSIELAMP